MTEWCRTIGERVFYGLYSLLSAVAVFFLARSVGNWWKLEIADGLAVVAVATYFAVRACVRHDDEELNRQDSSVSRSSQLSEQGGQIHGGSHDFPSAVCGALQNCKQH
jgi:hypothetical protein